MSKWKIAAITILCLIYAGMLSGCMYNIPEGYSAKLHPYNEAVEYAVSLSADAVVDQQHADLKNVYDHSYREWNAVIDGTECHVASVMRRVWNEGIAAGEFAKECYVMDTDYDYYTLKSILEGFGLDWQMDSDDSFNRYNWNDLLLVKLPVSAEIRLTNDELEAVWAEALRVNEAFEQKPTHKKILFCIPTPDGYSAGTEEFTGEAKAEFFAEYNERWE